VLKSLVYQMEIPSTIVQDVRRQVSNHVLLDLEFVGCVSWNIHLVSKLFKLHRFTRFLVYTNFCSSKHVYKVSIWLLCVRKCLCFQWNGHSTKFVFLANKLHVEFFDQSHRKFLEICLVICFKLPHIILAKFVWHFVNSS